MKYFDAKAQRRKGTQSTAIPAVAVLCVPLRLCTFASKYFVAQVGV
jgi:hypothetical protein